MPFRIGSHVCRLLAAAACVSITCCSDDAPTRPKPVAPAASSVDAEKIEASLLAINQYMQTGDWIKAEAIARTLLTRAPDEPRAHEMLGQLLIEKAAQIEASGDAGTSVKLKQQAWMSYRTAVELDSSNAGLHHSAGLVAMTAGQHDEALMLFLKAESLDSTNAQFPLFAAQLLMQAQKLDDADAALRRALSIAPDEPYVHASLAMLALERDQFDDALASMSIARRAEPDNIGFRAQQAKIHRRRNQPRIALELLIGLDEPSRVVEAVAFEIASSYDALGEHAKAADAWGLCFRGNPASPRAHLAAVRAGECALKAQDRDSALRWASIAQRLNPESDEVRELVARLRHDSKSSMNRSSP